MVTVCFSLVTASCALPTAPQTHGFADLVGKWQWKIPKNGCVETMEFFADGTRHVVSGKELSDSTYVIEAVPNSQKLKLMVTTTRDFGGEDCGGSSDDDTGQTWSSFIEFSPQKDRLLSCGTEADGVCNGPYRRLPK